MNGADPAQDLGGVQCPDAAELSEGAARRFDGGLDVAGGFGDATVQLADLGDEVHGQAAQRLERGLAGPDRAQDLSGAIGGQTTRSSCGCEVGEQHVRVLAFGDISITD